jgi:succinoglycan biosynthesis transport protein ExoP
MDEITQYWLILRRRWLPASGVCAMVVALTTVVTFQQKPIYQSTGQIQLMKTNSTADLLGVGKEGGLASAVSGSNPANTQAQLINSIPVAQQTIATLNLSQKPESFLKPLKVANLKSTDILEISYNDTDPRKAATIINTLMDIYIKNDISAQRSEAKSAREFVEKQLPVVETTVKQAEGDLRRFKEQNKVINLDEEEQSSGEAIANVQQQLTDASAKLAAVNARVAGFRQLFGNDVNGTVIAASVGESPASQKAMQDLQDVQQKLALERTRFQESHPVIADLKSKEATLQDILQKRTHQTLIGEQPIPRRIVPVAGGVQQSLIQDFAQAETERNSLEKQIAALIQVAANYKQRIDTLPKLEQQQRELERKLKAAQSTYEILLSKLQEIRVTENQNVGNARIVTPAMVPERPIAPKKAQNMAVGGVLGILLGLATALALETTDRTIKTSDDAKKLFGYPVLGIIPTFGKAEGVTTVRFGNQRQSIPEVVVRNSPGSPVSEAFRMLQTNLRFMSLDNQLKVIVISSSIPQEGKSTTAANLAVAMAQLGRRVLIVDADMRKPSQHNIWQIPNEVGLSSVLTGQSEFNPALVPVMDNLDILPAGITPPNPLVLLDSSQMAILVGQWAQTYDFVIIDSPPLTVAADTTILCKMANGIVFVVRPGVADSGGVTYCKELLEQSGQNILGMVINGITPQTGNYYNYYYYRSTPPEEVADQPSESIRRHVS